MVAAGVALPVNLALFCGNGEDGGSNGTYQWQADLDGNLLRDPNEALNQISKDACAKLKNDFGNDMEVHVINFRGQGDIDECASGADHVYSAANQEELEKILEIIEIKIREDDRYKKAGVVN